MKNANLAFLVFSLTVCLTMLLTVPEARGIVLMSEGFNYNDFSGATIVARTGGFSEDANNQWGSAWTAAPWNPGGFDQDTWSISGSIFETNTVLGSAVPGATQGVGRLIQENQATNTYYFGMDVKFWPGTSSLGAASNFGIGFDNPGGGGPDVSAISIVRDFAAGGGSKTFLHGNITTGGQSSADDPTGNIVADGNFHRLVGRLTFDKGGSNEELVMWIEPTLETDPVVLTHHAQDIGSSLNGMTMSIQARDVYAHPTWQMDNLNLTTDFESARVGALDNNPLSYGHTQMIRHGLQLAPFTDFGDPGTTTFDPVNWADSHNTTADFLDRVHPGAQVSPPTGFPTDNSLPWSRLMPLAQVGANLEPGEVPFVDSLVHLYVDDEADITIPGIRTAIAGHVQKIHDNYPGVMATANFASSQIVNPATGAVQPEMLLFLAEAKPDAIIVNNYPYIDPGHPQFDAEGGSPTFMYTVFERVRQLGLAGHDGSGLAKPIPTGIITQAFTDGAGTQWDRAPSESEIRQQHFAAWAFGMTTAKPFIYDDFKGNSSVDSVMFSDNFPPIGGTDNPTVTFDHFAETNRQSANLGDTLVRLISSSAHMVMGQHDPGGGAVANTTPMAVDTWDAGDDPFITSISATNLGILNDGLAGDVIVGYFNPLDEQFTDAGIADDDDLYFMIVNGLSDIAGLASATQQEITINFDFTSDTSITSLQRLSRDTGLVEIVPWTIDNGDDTYVLELILDGGTGDLFKFNTGSTFIVGPSTPGDFNGDDVVDGADFLFWQRNLGDATNLGIWQGAYGNGALAAAAASSAAVPEPTALLLSLLGIVAMAGSRRNCRSWIRQGSGALR